MILLTRPYQQSLALAQILGEQNCVIAPMMEIKKCKFTVPKDSQAIISTSNNVDYDADIKIPTQGKNAKEILRYCQNNLSRNGERIIYLSGDDVTLDIAAKLRKQGFDAERVIAYEQVPAMPRDIDLSEISLATFFSLNSLKNFQKLYTAQDLSQISCLCISKKLQKTAEKMGWKEVVIAKTPDLAGMLNNIRAYKLDS